MRIQLFQRAESTYLVKKGNQSKELTLNPQKK